VIGSAGAISLAEITALGKPSIIIPKAYTAENHQEYNAKSVESKGAGIAILEKNLTPESLNETVFKLLGDRDLLIDMSNASREIGKPEAIDLIYKEVMEVYNKNNKKEEKLQAKNDNKKEDESKEVKTIGIKNKK
ncbi:MAG: UDP-N-acetylglucosamine--N-acetylmuramyl-(pentapeptide) pyrophosphoryl-undecaprenol N-acetylglucosamine transferase, partial [Paraclostridium sp.]